MRSQGYPGSQGSPEEGTGEGEPQPPRPKDTWVDLADIEPAQLKLHLHQWDKVRWARKRAERGVVCAADGASSYAPTQSGSSLPAPCKADGGPDEGDQDLAEALAPDAPVPRWMVRTSRTPQREAIRVVVEMVTLDPEMDPEHDLKGGWRAECGMRTERGADGGVQVLLHVEPKRQPREVPYRIRTITRRQGPGCGEYGLLQCHDQWTGQGLMSDDLAWICLLYTSPSPRDRG